MKKSIAVLALGAALVLTGCGDGGIDFAGDPEQLRDLKGVDITDPDKVRMTANVEGHPNIIALCIEGAGFATTTRAANGVVTRVEVWDATNGGWCAK